MKEKQARKWKKTRSGGQLKFVLLKGMLGWGVPVFVLMSFGGLYLPMIEFADDWSDITPRCLVGQAALWSAGGLVLGKSIWEFNERLYARYVEEHNDQQDGDS